MSIDCLVPYYGTCPGVAVDDLLPLATTPRSCNVTAVLEMQAAIWQSYLQLLATRPLVAKAMTSSFLLTLQVRYCV